MRLKLDGKWVKKVVPLNSPPAELETWLRASYSVFATAAEKKVAKAGFGKP